MKKLILSLVIIAGTVASFVGLCYLTRPLADYNFNGVEVVPCGTGVQDSLDREGMIKI